MKILENISENEMVATFLKGEITSNRFSSPILKKLKEDKKSSNIIEFPNIENIEDNNYRKEVLGVCRGYGINDNIFTNFPKNIEWKRALLSKNELGQVKYIDYDYWNEISGGSRLVRDGAKNILEDKEVFNQSNKGFLDAAEAVKEGQKFITPILVSKDENSDLVILEGHLRLTAFCMAIDFIPDETEVLVGFSSEISHWNMF